MINTLLITKKNIKILLLALTLSLSLFCLESQAQSNQVDSFNIETEENAERAEWLSLQEPFDDYYRIITSMSLTDYQYSELLSALCSAVASSGDSRKSWQLTQKIRHPVYRADARVNIATIYLNQGNRDLANDALNAVWSDINYVPEQQSSEERWYQNKVISKAVAITIDAFGLPDMLRRIAKTEDPVAAGLMVAHFVRLLDAQQTQPIDNENIPLALLDTAFNQLDQESNAGRYVDGALTLSQKFSDFGDEGKIRAKAVIKKIIDIMTQLPQLATPDRQRRLAIAFVASSSDSRNDEDVASYVSSITEGLNDPIKNADLLIGVGDRYAKNQNNQKALDYYQAAEATLEGTAKSQNNSRVIEKLIMSYTEINRLADAFDVMWRFSAASKEQEESRAEKSYVMAKILIGKNRADLVSELWPYIPYSDLRTELLLLAAQKSYENKKPTEGLTYIAEIFGDFETRAEKPTYKAGFFNSILNIANRYMEPKDREILTSRLFEELKRVDNPAERYLLELEILKFQSKQSKSMENRALQRVKTISTEVWPYKNDPQYPRLAAEIVNYMADKGLLEHALTQAASINASPADEESLKNKREAFASVIREALARGDLSLTETTLSTLKDNEQRRVTLLHLLTSIANDITP